MLLLRTPVILIANYVIKLQATKAVTKSGATTIATVETITIGGTTTTMNEATIIMGVGTMTEAVDTTQLRLRPC